MKGPGPRTYLQVLLWSACVSLLEQQATQSPYYPVSTSSQLQPLISSFIYVIEPGITMNICPVLISDTSQEFLIQPAPSGRPLHGQFLTNTSLADTQFNGTQVVRTCAEIVGQLCDQLVLRVNSGSEVTPGSFRVRYVPARGGQNIEVDVLYGAPGIMYLGEFQPNVPIVLDKTDALTFKLRIRLSSRFTPPNIIVCESISGSSFQQSKMLELSSPFPAVVTTCLHSSDNSASSRPYTVRVLLADSVKESADFSQRWVKLVINTSCSSVDPLITSEVLTVVGLNATTVGTETTTMETTTALTTSTTDFIRPPLGVEGIIGITGGAVVLFVVIVGVVAACCVSRYRKSQSQDNGGRNPLNQCLVGNEMDLNQNQFELRKTREDDVDEVDHHEQNACLGIRVLPFLSVGSEQWIEEFENKLADIYGAGLMPKNLNADESPQHSSSQQWNFDELKSELRSAEFKMLCIVRDDCSATESPTCAQLLQLFEQSPEFKDKVVVVTFDSPKDEIKQLEWCLDIRYQDRGESRETAEKLYHVIEMGQCKDQAHRNGKDRYQARRESLDTAEKLCGDIEKGQRKDQAHRNGKDRSKSKSQPRSKSLGHAVKGKLKPNRTPYSETQSQTHLLLKNHAKTLQSLSDEIHRQGEKLDSHREELHRQGAKIEEKLDHHGAQIEEKLDHHGARIEEKLDHHGEKLDGQGETLEYLATRADEMAVAVGQDNSGTSAV